MGEMAMQEKMIVEDQESKINELVGKMTLEERLVN